MTDRAHSWVAPHLMPRIKPAEITPGQPIRIALGYNAAGDWIWQDGADHWPYGRADLSAEHDIALRGEYDG